MGNCTHSPHFAALGSTAREIDLAALGDLHLGTVPKFAFSMMPCVKGLLDNRNIDSVVLFGIEVSGAKSPLQALDLGY